MPEFLDSTGKIIYLGREVGRGGEGAVYEVLDKPEFVAKIYHEPVSADKAEKLRQMCALQDGKLLKLAAWVVETLHSPPHGQTVGFLMPRVHSGTAIHELYNPKSRRQHFPEADWRFLVRAAGNLARAFSIVHTHGHAIGDVNHGNIVIARDATVKLIDCDSYQLNAPERSFLCEVGVSTHTPPELQGKSLREIERTSNHDGFGLAVLIFQLLFMGRHPFSGTFLGVGENTLENSIKEHRFAYGDGAAQRQMKQPPATSPLNVVSTELAKLFERAFLEVENRPTVKEWIDALDKLENNLHDCQVNSSHFYLKSLNKCPWCRLEGETGVLFFPPRLTGEFGANGEFDLITVGRLIDAIKPPELERSLPAATVNFLVNNHPLQPASARLKANLEGYQWGLVAYLIAVAFCAFWFGFFWNLTALLFIGFGIYSICSAAINGLLKKARDEAQLAVDEAHFKWGEFKEDLNKTVAGVPFEKARQELKLQLKDYGDLSKFREVKIKELENQRREKRLDFYLQGHAINKAAIGGLDAQRVEKLAQHGIITASDVNKKKFAAIPNFSYLHQRKLFEWRGALERKFDYQPTAQELTADFASLEGELRDYKKQLETNIKEGLPRLQQISVGLTKKYQDLTVQSESLASHLKFSESDLKRIEKLKNIAVGWTIAVIAVSFIGGSVIGSGVNMSQKIAKTDYGLTETENSSGHNTRHLADFNSSEDNRDSHENFPENWGEAEKLYRSGLQYLDEERNTEAVEVLRRAIKSNPNIAAIHRKLGDSFYQLNRYQEALTAYENAIKIKEKDWEGWYKAGLTNNKLKRLNEAEYAFHWAIKYYPNYAEAYYEMGVLLKKQNKLNEAVENLETAIEIKPEMTEAHYELGLCYLNQRNSYLAWGQQKILSDMNTPLAKKLQSEINKFGLKPFRNDEVKTGFTTSPDDEEAPRVMKRTL